MNIMKLRLEVRKIVSDNDKAPQFKAFLKDPENDYATVGEVGLWYSTDRETGDQRLDSNGNPFLSGAIKEPYKKDNA